MPRATGERSPRVHAREFHGAAVVSLGPQAQAMGISIRSMETWGLCDGWQTRHGVCSGRACGLRRRRQLTKSSKPVRKIGAGRNGETAPDMEGVILPTREPPAGEPDERVAADASWWVNYNALQTDEIQDAPLFFSGRRGGSGGHVVLGHGHRAITTSASFPLIISPR